MLEHNRPILHWWRHNRLFWIAFSLFFILGGILLMLINKGDAILYFNGQRSPWGDLFFAYFTKAGEQFAYLALLLILLFVQYRYALILPLIGLSVTLVSALSKYIFSHPRPALYFQQEGLLGLIHPVAGVALHGGNTSFPSGHTMSAFALYTFLALSLAYKRSLSLVFLLFAVLVGVSRIYLVQHFLEDVVTGAAMGAAIGVLWYHWQYRLFPMPHPWADKKLTFFFNKKSAKT
ncbi:MAG: phosphatase PAP2 family protein [Saprospiraceae bacterium]